MKIFMTTLILILCLSGSCVLAQQNEDGSPDDRPMVAVEGQVTYDGKPVEDAILMLSHDSDEKGTFPVTTNSDAFGRYFFFDVTAGNFTLKIEKLGFLPGRREVQYDGKTRVRVDLILAPGQLSFGKVPPGLGAEEERIFYATDRRRQNSIKLSYANERDKDGKLSYGFIDVNVPSTSGIELADADRVRNVFVENTEELTEQKFVIELGGKGAEALVFVHGFKNSFDYAARRLGALKHDLHFKGPAILFSWASCNDGSPRGYAEDESTIDWSDPHFRKFLTDLSKAHFSKIHFIAHSMGNRLLLKGLDSGVHVGRVDEVVFAAPDVDMDTFREALSRLRPAVGRFTMYGSSQDQALRASRFIHRQPRAGLLDPVLTMPVLDTVDATKVDLSFIHHSYFVDSTPVEEDISLVLSDKVPPRSRLIRRLNGGDVFWLLQ